MFTGKKIKQHLETIGLTHKPYACFGGTVLAVLGLRETQDIDLLISPELFKELQEDSRFTLVEKYGRLFLEMGDTIEMCATLPEDFPDPQQMLSRKVIVDGVSILSKKDFITTKKFFGREKDLKDIDLVKDVEW